MSVYLKADSSLTELGNGDFLHGFFSTISYRLEKDGWGSRFPAMMTLYDGELPKNLASQALAELKQIQQELAAFPPKDVVWDIEDLDKQPPWGDQISADITNLSNYFVTNSGKDLFKPFFESIEYLQNDADCKSILLTSQFF